jgi:hypothetical protein
MIRLITGEASLNRISKIYGIPPSWVRKIIDDYELRKKEEDDWFFGVNQMEVPLSTRSVCGRTMPKQNLEIHTKTWQSKCKNVIELKPRKIV